MDKLQIFRRAANSAAVIRPTVQIARRPSWGWLDRDAWTPSTLILVSCVPMALVSFSPNPVSAVAAFGICQTIITVRMRRT